VAFAKAKGITAEEMADNAKTFRSLRIPRGDRGNDLLPQAMRRLDALCVAVATLEQRVTAYAKARRTKSSTTNSTRPSSPQAVKSKCASRSSCARS